MSPQQLYGSIKGEAAGMGHVEEGAVGTAERALPKCVNNFRCRSKLA